MLVPFSEFPSKNVNSIGEFQSSLPAHGMRLYQSLNPRECRYNDWNKLLAERSRSTHVPYVPKKCAVTADCQMLSTTMFSYSTTITQN